MNTSAAASKQGQPSAPQANQKPDVAVPPQKDAKKNDEIKGAQ